MSERRPTRAEAITAALAEARLDESSRSAVDFYLDRADDGWRECCGSDCFPCISQVGLAVDVARGLLRAGAES